MGVDARKEEKVLYTNFNAGKGLSVFTHYWKHKCQWVVWCRGVRGKFFLVLYGLQDW